MAGRGLPSIVVGRIVHIDKRRGDSFCGSVQSGVNHDLDSVTVRNWSPPVPSGPDWASLGLNTP